MTVSLTGLSVRLFVSLCAAFLPLIGGFTVHAQPATPDLTFNSTGFRFEAFGVGFLESRAVAVQSDGKIIAAGAANMGGATGIDLAVVRYNADGSLDTSFDGDGRATVAIAPGTNPDFAEAIAVQPDGKIVAAGYAAMGATGADFVVVRLNADGTLDATFDGDGKVVTAIGPGAGFDTGRGVALQTDGKIVVAGDADMGGATGTDFAVVRYNTDGSLDTSFDTDGRATTAIGSGNSTDSGFAMGMQTDGKIVMAGYASAGTGDFALARFNANGGLDASFDGDGRLTTTITPTSGDAAYGMVIQPDGKIVASGFANMGATGNDFALVRYNADGSLDAAFDADGKTTTAIAPGAGGENARALAIQADGKIVAAGDTNPGGLDFALARYNTDGTLDTTFDTDGKATFDFGGNEYASGISLYPYGRVVAVGRNAFITARIWLDAVFLAADVTLSGRVTDERGRSIRGARLTLTDPNGASRAAVTNSFGYYAFRDVDSGQGYTLSVTARGHTFADPVRFVQANEDLAGLDFTARRAGTGNAKPEPQSPGKGRMELLR